MQLKVNDLKVIPYFKTKDGWSIPDSDMCCLFRMFTEEGITKKMFPFGGISSEIDFIIWFRNKENSMSVISDKDGPLMIFWINKQSGKSCHFHFGCLKRSWGKRTKDLLKTAGRYIFGLKYKDVRIFDVIIGNLDSRNKVAINLAKKIGVTVIGEIPYYFRDNETGNYVPSIVTHLTYKEVEKWEAT